MDILERIIENLTSDEVRRFKILSNRFKADEEKKLLVLFDAIRAGGFKEIEEDVITQFYGSTQAKAKNSYYRLRNKLLSNLEKSLLFYHFNYKNSIESYSNIQLSILFRERGLYREAFHNLKKAEKVALAHDQFNVLEVIYDEMVKLATTTNFEIDIERILGRRRENLQKIDILRANSEVLGMVTQQLMRRNYSRSKKSQTVIESLENIKSRLEEHKGIFQSASGKIMVMKAVVSILIQKSAYRELEQYVKETFEDFERNKLFSKDNHSTRLLMRIWRINALQKLLELQEAINDINLLKEEVKMYKKQNFNEFAFYYYTSNVYTLKLLGKLDTAGDILKEAFSHKEILQNEISELYLLISLGDQYFSQELFSKAKEVLKKITTHKGFSFLDEELRFYILIFEVVNAYESKDYKFAEVRYKYIRKVFRHFLKDDFYSKAVKFLDIVMRMNTAAIENKKVFLKAAYKNFTSEFNNSEIGDNQVIIYEIYLQSKLEEKSYYQLLVEEVGQKAR
ncbi:MAG: hypothetical protein AAF824_09570 [Bacteroidota bacterium]